MSRFQAYDRRGKVPIVEKCNAAESTIIEDANVAMKDR